MREFPGARRLGGNAIGLAPWATTTLQAESRPPLEITATPCRHGPPLSRPIVGHVVGFALESDTESAGLRCLAEATGGAFVESPTAWPEVPLVESETVEVGRRRRRPVVVEAGLEVVVTQAG